MRRLRNIAMRDYQESVTSEQTDRQTPDKVIPMCRYASQATQKWYDTCTPSFFLHDEYYLIWGIFQDEGGQFVSHVYHALVTTGNTALRYCLLLILYSLQNSIIYSITIHMIHNVYMQKNNLTRVIYSTSSSLTSLLQLISAKAFRMLQALVSQLHCFKLSKVCANFTNCFSFFFAPSTSILINNIRFRIHNLIPQ